MKVVFTRPNTSYACRVHNIMPLAGEVALEYRSRDDSRTLVVVLTCPCCNNNDPLLSMENAVFVSPFHGIYAKDIVQCIELFPLYSSPVGVNEDEFCAAFKRTIDIALKQ